MMWSVHVAEGAAGGRELPQGRLEGGRPRTVARVARFRKMSRTATSIETKGGSGVSGAAQGEGEWPLSFWGDENVLGLDQADDCERIKKRRRVHFKTVKMANVIAHEF